MVKLNKVIKLECMTNGIDRNGNPCRTIQNQMKKILEDNQDYDFVSLVYHKTRTQNMEYASLILKY